MVAIGENPDKAARYLFSIDERLAMAEHSLAHIPNVECVTFKGLLAEYAYRNGFDVIVRGVRNGNDLDQELVLAAVNESLHPNLETVFYPTRPTMAHISSSVVRAIVKEGGDVSEYCPLYVKEQLEKRLLKRFTVGVAGGIASGKTWFSENLLTALKKYTEAGYISLDAVGHYVLSDSEGAIYRATREEIARTFGESLMNEDGSIDRKELGKIVFADPFMLDQLNSIMREPILTRLYEESKSETGVLLIEGAILVEANWTHLMNNNIILVDAPEETRIKRLMDRMGVDRAEAESRVHRQLSASERRMILEDDVALNRWGRIWNVQSKDDSVIDFDKLASEIAKLNN